MLIALAVRSLVLHRLILRVLAGPFGVHLVLPGPLPRVNARALACPLVELAAVSCADKRDRLHHVGVLLGARFFAISSGPPAAQPALGLLRSAMLLLRERGAVVRVLDLNCDRDIAWGKAGRDCYLLGEILKVRDKGLELGHLQHERDIGREVVHALQVDRGYVHLGQLGVDARLGLVHDLYSMQNARRWEEWCGKRQTTS